MSGQHGKRIRSSRRLWQWIKNRMIQDVPEDDAVCEFDCRKGQCTVGVWKTCESRLRERADREQAASQKQPQADSS